MTSRVAWWSAWSIAVVTCLLALARVVLAIVDPASSDQSSAPNVPGGGVPVATFEATVLVTLALVGAVVASRQPRNAVGWILCVAPLSLGILILGSHAFWALTLGQPEPSRTAIWVAWAASWTWVPAVIPTLTLFPLLIPTGRVPTPRWRPATWLCAAAIAVLVVSEALRPWRLSEYPVDNPIGVGGVTVYSEVLGDILWVAASLVAFTSLVVRVRRSRGEERQQLKWVAAGAVLFVATFVTAASTEGFVGGNASFAIIVFGWMFMAGGVAVAILRFRLYDIDVVINRALVYGSLTALLAGGYLGSVLLLQVVLESFTGGSGLAVAASTLGTAALFGPLRTRVQGIVDRRFFRRKYDATQTLQRFGARLRDEVDLDSLTGELRRVVAESMQPAHVSLWVRPQEPVR